MTLDPSVGTSNIQYEASRASLYDTPGPSTQVLETQAPVSARNKRLCREIRPRHTSTHLSLGECFVDVDVFFYFRDCNLYFILFERLYFILFIYDLKFSFSYLWFEMKFLQTLK
jgi:hypothetical protein